MPLYKSIPFCDNTKILVWKVTESLSELMNSVRLQPTTLIRVDTMKSEMHRRAFLSVRMLLQEAGYSDFDIYYDEFGKPHLKDGTDISITHSFTFSAIILSNRKIGIDIELRREMVARLDYKFIDHEFNYLNKEDREDYISRLTVIWGVKEAIFKIRNEVGISFKDHIEVQAFEMKDQKATTTLHFGNLSTHFKVYFEEFENFILVYVLEY
ncbi:4'-phosphopantetheinyl transferase family protein [Flavobacterium sp. 3HN19-14]|uniref:4'-phosphopantetheinyl transferase family protein n=1 Tax=Flavobacterium sp. 3HN19-14 TaxID=3448133 RepID=UPI003EE2B66E